MKVALIGSGNAATQLGLLLKRKGQRVEYVWSRQFSRARTLAKKISAKPVRELSEIPPGLDLYLIAVKDDEVKRIAADLKTGNGVIAHISGSLGIEVFGKRTLHYGVLWPVMTFSKFNKEMIRPFPVVYNGNDVMSRSILKKIAQKLSKEVYHLPEEKRKWAHLAAVFANNFTNHLFTLSEGILTKNGCPKGLLHSLIRETTHVGTQFSTTRLQSGPARRNDLKTLEKHGKMLKTSPLLKAIYKAMSESIVKNKA